jgi:hypothetical protein
MQVGANATYCGTQRRMPSSDVIVIKHTILYEMWA